MKARHITGCVAGVVALVFAGPAFAQEDPFDPEEPDPIEEEEPMEEEQEDPMADPMEEEPTEEEPVEPAPPIEPELEEPATEEEGIQATLRDIGVGVSVGGGVMGFTDDEARDLADVGGAWDGRVAVGTKFPVGVEAAYVGSAQDIEALGLDEDAVLVGNGVEGNARVNIPIVEQLTPYALGGIGWTNYSIVNEDFNTSNVQDNDNVGYIPLGAGVTYRVGRAAFDLRGMIRPAFNEDLVDTEAGDDDTGLNTWGVNARVGFEF